jgi:CcmD family protein
MSIYLLAAYAVFWAFTFVFVLRLWTRQRRIEREISALQDQLERAESTD